MLGGLIIGCIVGLLCGVTMTVFVLAFCRAAAEADDRMARMERRARWRKPLADAPPYDELGV